MTSDNGSDLVDRIMNEPLEIKFKRDVEQLKFYDSYNLDEYYPATVKFTITIKEKIGDYVYEKYYTIWRENQKYVMSTNFKGGYSRRPLTQVFDMDLDDVFDWFNNLIKENSNDKTTITYNGFTEAKNTTDTECFKLLI
jgi:hypothetical protein